ncbi:hypothetical protein BN135_3298 [Cronobacter muytjensii 530]
MRIYINIFNVFRIIGIQKTVPYGLIFDRSAADTLLLVCFKRWLDSVKELI